MSDSEKKFIKRVKANQEEVMAAQPQPIVELRVVQFDNGMVQVFRPEGNDPGNLAAIVELLSNAVVIIARKIAEGDQRRLLTLPPGARLRPGVKLEG